MTDTIEVPENETVTHFAYSSRFYGADKLKYNAFMDPKEPGEVSVFRVDTLSESEIWKIGDELRSRSDKRLAKARGDLKVSDIVSIKNEQEQNLKVIEEKTSHHLHANIVNLPLEDAKQRVVAIQIATKTTLVMKP